MQSNRRGIAGYLLRLHEAAWINSYTASTIPVKMTDRLPDQLFGIRPMISVGGIGPQESESSEALQERFRAAVRVLR